jgi:hypothetical protein
MDQPAGDRRYVVDRLVERWLVCLGWGVEATQLADELQRGSANLLVGRRRIKVEEYFDVSAHMTFYCASDNGGRSSDR